MEMASGLIEATTPRPTDRLVGERNRPDGPTLFESFAACGEPAMEALALAVAVLHGDELLARRLRSAVREVAGAPGWVSSMGDVEITGTFLNGHLLGDGDNVMVSWRWPAGQAATAIVYIDHNVGTVVKDAFVIPEGGDVLAGDYERMGDDHMWTVPIDPADARARVLQTIAAGDHMLPPFESESWPACRPMVEWIVRRLPEGGTGYVRPEWSEADRDRLVDEFVASELGRVGGLARDEVRELADPLVWFACDYGPGDPLRWSPVSVEIVLTDWYPRKVLAPAAELRAVPDVLAAFVRFAHDRQAVPADLTAETLDAVERWRGEFGALVSRPGRSAAGGVVGRLQVAAGIGEHLHDAYDDDDDDLFDPIFGDDGEIDMRRMLDVVEADVIELVGGQAAYGTLDDEPLGDVPFDWSAVPDRLREPTDEALARLDEWAVELFDAEVRTIARSVLAGVVAADPRVFDRSPRTDALAAAILYFLVKRLTGRFSAAERRALPWKVSTQKELATATGVPASMISSRTRTVANTVERARIDWPSILHSTQRHEALRFKQLLADWRREHG